MNFDVVTDRFKAKHGINFLSNSLWLFLFLVLPETWSSVHSEVPMWWARLLMDRASIGFNTSAC
jgi:hypothetical protein